MKKWGFVLLLTLTAMIQVVYCKPVSVQSAQTVALNFFKLNSASAQGIAIGTSLKYTHKDANGNVDFYVFDILPVKGFVMVAADDLVKPIIGYSTQSNFNPNVSHIGLSDFMKRVEFNITTAVQQAIPADYRTLNQWNSYSLGINPNSSRSSTMPPLVTTFWNQNPYYNDQCPMHTIHSLRAVTGCVATTMAQIMKYWNYPAKGTGSYTYDCSQPYFSNNFGVLSANFGATTYNWANMPATVTSANTDVATLMYHCGVAVAMDYGCIYEGGSGAYVSTIDVGAGRPCAQNAFATYFGYDATTMRGVRLRNYTSDSWMALMKSELNARRPIQYYGFDAGGGGHTWVCDGYDANDMLHMNWGWGGTDDGYFTITALTAAGYNFNVNEAALIGIQPLATPPVANFMANTTTSCNGTVNFKDLTVNYPSTWLWNFGDGNTSTAQHPSHTYASNGTYTVTLTATNSKGTNTKTVSGYITVSRAAAPVANNISNCASSTFSLSAATANPVKWYDSTGNIVSTSNPFVTNLLTKTTTYWVEEYSTAASYHVGPVSNTIGSGGNFASNMRVMKYKVNKPGVLSSVYVYAANAGYRTIRCMDSLGTIFQQKTVYCPAGGSRVTLNFDLVPGGPYYMGLGDTSNLWRNSTGASYPYNDANGIVSIIGNDGGPTATGYYYYFYDWIVKELDCTSQRKAVTATVGALNASINTSTNPTCFGLNNGTATVTGGSGSYTYQWSNNQTSATATGLGQGSYTVTVNDGTGCSVTLSKTINQPAVVSPTANATNISCNGGSNGAINLSVSGGTGGYSFNWGGGITSQNRTGLSAGTYNVTVTDANGCSSTTSRTITQPAALSPTATPTNVACNGGANGAINLSVSGGTSGYTYNWGGGVTSQNRTGLTAGSYAVTITDANGCTTTASQTLTQPTALSPSATTTDVACGGNTGAINVSVTGGTGAYTYNWGGGITSQNRTNLGAGTYTVTITDANSCTASLSKTITQINTLVSSATGNNATCNGAANGTINISVSGGNPTYSYNWGGGITSQNRTGLAAGTYTVTITDASGCTSTASQTITQPTAITPTANNTNITCNGSANGSITLSVTGGAGNYSYNWGGGVTSQNRSNLAAGTYTVTITDANSCTSTTSKTITQPNAITPTATPTNITCNGAANGAISLAVTGGTGSYTYNWGGGVTSQNRTGLTAGTYSATITDANNCTSTVSQTITQPAALSPVTSANNVSCSGGSNGSIGLTVSGGNPNYTFNWGGGITTQNRTGLTAGTYSATITDANGCTATTSRTITQPAALSPTATTTNIACSSGNTGSITLSVSGGTGAYSYNWGGGITTQNRTNLAAGTYTVTITDANNCTTTLSRTITQSSSLSISSTANNVSCNGGNNGTINLSVSGGNPTYSYNWGGGVISQNRTGLAAGTYTVTITDASGCTSTETKTITQPSVISPVTTANNVSCNGGSNGTINLTVSGGNPNYTYNWGGGITSQTRTGLTAGTYSATITDANGCTATTSRTITQPAALNPTATTVNIACSAANTGAINVTVTGGTGTYTYNWGGGITTQNRSNLAAGTYTVTITDANTCTATLSKTITQTNSLTVNAVSTNVLCNGGNNGTINVTVGGGNPTYTYNWGGGITSQNRTGLAAGTYTVTITDASNCTSTASKTITQPAALSPATTATNVSCYGATNGTINLTVSGGNPNYTYNWGSGITSQNRTGLAAGTYTVTITDASNCTSTTSKTITQPAALSPATTATNVSCYGATNGTINLTVSGGNPTYTYNWGGGITSQNRTGLAAGTYNVTITDANGCTSTSSKTITQPAAINANATSTNVACNGANSGAINLTVSGGNPNYTYNWGGGITSQNRTGLASGTYTVTVTDANGCTATLSKTITQTNTLFTAASSSNVSCFGGNNGAINLTVSGGNPTYTYNWGGGITSQNRSNLAAGTYTVTITDASGCTTTSTKTITQPIAFSTTTTSTDVACNGGNNGSINLTVSGGNPNYTYNWGSGVTTKNRTGLSAGTYSVTISDANGCTTTASKTISQPAILAAGTTATNVLCYGGNNGSINLSVSGGTGAYSYNWGGGITTQNRTNLAAGTYHVTVTDVNGCTSTSSKTITQPAALSPTATATHITCNTGNTGAINLTVTGGTGNYTYNWGGGITTQNRAGLSAGTYTVTITDVNGCSTSLSEIITQTGSPVTSAAATNVKCFGGNDGSITITVSGGNPTYTYNWGAGVTSQNRTGLTAGTYSVTITDANGCSSTASKTITQPATAIAASATTTNVSCGNGNTGAITLSVTGGNPTYTYNWGGGITTQNRTGLAAGNYTVTITDATGCTSTLSKIVTQTNSIISSANVTPASCFGGSNGTISVSVSGGNPGYTYNWGGGITSQNRANLAAGDYTVTVTDASGCVSILTKTVSEPAAIVAVPSVTNITCHGGNTGAINLTVNGGKPSYTFSWGNNVSSQNRTGLTAGTYTVTVTDAAGCKSSMSATISQSPAIAPVVTPGNVSCNGNNNGTINLAVTGGKPGYTYNWGSGITSQNRIGLAAGTYTVTITDANSCTATATQTITQPLAITATATATNIACFGGSTGAINLTVSGGTSGYTYNWGGGVTSQNRVNLAAGTYTVTITDAHGCTSSTSKTLTQASAISTTASTITHVNCHNTNTGSISLVASGGTGAYTYNWGGGLTSQNRSNLPAGTYTATITDGAGCKTTFSEVITEPTPLKISTTITDASCNLSNGGASAIGSGGTAGYSYSWNNQVTDASIANVPAGSYVVTVTDNNQCSSSATVVISNASSLETAIAVTNNMCFGKSTGSAIVSVTSGAAPFSYLWADGDTSNKKTNLMAGEYKVTITDAFNCQRTENIKLSDPASITASYVATNNTCHGDNAGSCIINVQGGTPGYTFSWSNGDSTNTAANLPAGNYLVTITDKNNCVGATSVVITQPDAIHLMLSATNSNDQNSGSVSVTDINNAVAPYTFEWSTGDTGSAVANLSAGTYEVTITDKNGCRQMASVTVGRASGIDEANNNFSFIAYPNPASAYITIKVSELNKETSYCLKNILGQTLVNSRLTALQTSLDLSGLAAGIYWIELARGDQRLVKEIIISR